MTKEVLQQLGSDSTRGARRLVAILVVVAGVALLGFIAWITVQLRATNDGSEIREVVGPIVAWALLAVGAACAAVIVDASERRHAVNVAQAGAGTGATGARPLLVSTRAWRGSALAGLAILAFSLALLASAQLGHLRSTTSFKLRGKADVAPCVATLWAPAIALTGDQVPVDLSVYCAQAPPQGMPPVTATYGAANSTDQSAPKVVTSFTAAKTLRPNERVWRWFVKFASGEQPLDVRLTFAGDEIAVPLQRISVSNPTTLASLQEYTTALGGLLGAVIGLFGTLGSLLKGWRGQSSTVVTNGSG